MIFSLTPHHSQLALLLEQVVGPHSPLQVVDDVENVPIDLVVLLPIQLD